MTDDIIYHRVLRPHRALTAKGQRIALYVLLALLLLLAPPILVSGYWQLLIFLLSPVVMLFIAFWRRNYASLLREEITIKEGSLRIDRYEINGDVLSFETEPYWVKLELRDDGPVKDYLTLRDQKRHVELGAFLAPEERQKLFYELNKAIRAITHPG